MNLPILILGHQRSGTTMLRRLVSMHPRLDYDIVHEKPRLLWASKDRDDAIKTIKIGVSSILSGQKVPYTIFAKAEQCIEKFLSLFPEGHIMHIIREPLETINSRVKTFKKEPDRCIRLYFASVPEVYNYTRKLPRSCQISYENLVGNPKKVLADIYRWMGEEVDPKHIERVITTQGPWEYNGRTMPGLRYFDRIVPKERKIILCKSFAKKILDRPLLNCKFDF